MNIKNKKYIASAMIGLTMLGYTGGASFADVSSNNKKIIPHDYNVNMEGVNINPELRFDAVGQELKFSAIGKNFYAQNEATTFDNIFQGITRLRSSSNVSTGKMAVTTSLYNSSGQLFHSTSWKYNSTTTNYVSSVTGISVTPNQVSSVGGWARVIDSNGKYIDKQLPYAKRYKNNISPEVQKEHDELYEKYKMIPALATNGEGGYVYESDLLGEAPKSPEEAIKIQESRKPGDFKLIPVYNKDGKNVIGEFRIEG